MKNITNLILLLVLVGGGSCFGAFSTAAGYSSSELYSTAGSFTTAAGLWLDGGSLYFGQDQEVKSLDLSDNSVGVDGTIGSNAGINLVARSGGVTYTSYGTSYSSPFPAKMGYFDGLGVYVNQLSQDGIYDAAVNSAGDCYIVANPAAAGSKIYKYGWSDGSIFEVADIGGYSGGLAFDSSDNLYYAEQTVGNVLRFDASEVLTGGLGVSDADVVLGITAGFIGFDGADNFYATTGWGSTFSKYDLSTGVKIEDVAYGGIGKFAATSDKIYAVDTDWTAYASGIEAISVPEPGSIFILLSGGLFAVSFLKRDRV